MPQLTEGTTVQEIERNLDYATTARTQVENGNVDAAIGTLDEAVEFTDENGKEKTRDSFQEARDAAESGDVDEAEEILGAASSALRLVLMLAE